MEQDPTQRSDRDPVPLGDALKDFLDDQSQQAPEASALDRLRRLLAMREAGEDVDAEELNEARRAAAQERENTGEQ